MSPEIINKSELMVARCILLEEMIIVYNRDSKNCYFTGFIDIGEAASEKAANSVNNEQKSQRYDFSFSLWTPPHAGLNYSHYTLCTEQILQ